MTDAWTAISASSNPDIDNVRRADPNHPLDFRFGRDFQGRCLFTLDGVAFLPERRPLPAIEGIDMALASGPGESFRLRMALLDLLDVGLFDALTKDLMGITAQLQSAESDRALLLVIDRLGRWQRLFMKRRNGLLTHSEAIGLAGELLFMRDCLLGQLAMADAVAAWRGPYGDEQDFVINSLIFEVKTQLATSDARVLVSSENQLDTASGEIAIVHQRLGISSAESSGAFTLNGLVQGVRSVVGEVGTPREALEVSLAESGFLDRREYDEPAWQLTERSFFLVGEGFPAIRPRDIPAGISNVKYAVSLAACIPFTVDGPSLLNRVIHG